MPQSNWAFAGSTYIFFFFFFFSPISHGFLRRNAGSCGFPAHPLHSWGRVACREASPGSGALHPPQSPSITLPVSACTPHPLRAARTPVLPLCTPCAQLAPRSPCTPSSRHFPAEPHRSHCRDPRGVRGVGGTLGVTVPPPDPLVPCTTARLSPASPRKRSQAGEGDRRRASTSVPHQHLA